MKQITRVRKSVCAMANELKKAGCSLSEAFRKAWQRIKLSMAVRAAGTTFENRQQRVMRDHIRHLWMFTPKRKQEKSRTAR